MSFTTEQYQQLLADIRGIIRQELFYEATAKATEEATPPRAAVLTPREVADQLGVTVAHVRALMKSGQIRSYQLGSRAYVKPEDLAAAFRPR